MDAKYIYPPIKFHLPTICPEKDIVDQYAVTRVMNPCPQKLCFTTSLFKKNPHNTYDDEHPVDEAGWKVRYLDGLTSNIKRLKEFGEEYKLRVHLAHDLEHLVDKLVALNPHQVEVHVMMSSSIGFGPGSLWRFLALSDTSLDVVGVVDIDSPFDKIFIDTLRQSTAEKLMCKSAAREPTIHCSSTGTFWGQYHMFQAGMFAMRPFDDKLIPLSLYAFTQYARDNQFQSEPVTIFNVPRGDHTNGWGRHQYLYGFDETFLKRVLYPMFKLSQVIHVGHPGSLELGIMDSSVAT